VKADLEDNGRYSASMGTSKKKGNAGIIGRNKGKKDSADLTDNTPGLTGRSKEAHVKVFLFSRGRNKRTL